MTKAAIEFEKELTQIKNKINQTTMDLEFLTSEEQNANE